MAQLQALASRQGTSIAALWHWPLSRLQAELTWPSGLLMLQLFGTDGRPLEKPRRILIEH